MGGGRSSGKTAGNTQLYRPLTNAELLGYTTLGGGILPPVHLVGGLGVGPDAGTVVGVPLVQHGRPIAKAVDVDEVPLHVGGRGVEAAVLDPHLAHPPPGQLLAVNLHRNGKMLRQGVALRVNGWRDEGSGFRVQYGRTF